MFASQKKFPDARYLALSFSFNCMSVASAYAIDARLEFLRSHRTKFIRVREILCSP